jgi:hypothetical protein
MVDITDVLDRKIVHIKTITSKYQIEDSLDCEISC